MAFQLQVSNSLEQLAERLCADLRSTHKDVFQPDYVITQTEGMNNWLKLQIAGQNGIAANCNFLKPNDLINTIYHLLAGAITKTLSADNLNWLLFKLLAQDEFVNKYPAISAYYHNEGPDRDVKRMALAEKMADLFDQYQIYRPDMIQRWNNKAPVNTSDSAWQKDLWLNAGESAGKNFPDKTIISKAIENALLIPDNIERLIKKMPVVYLFGISLVTKYHLEIFQQLAKHIDIHFLILNPAPSIYWFEDKSEKQLAFLKKLGKIDHNATHLGNPLLTGWGKIIRDTFSMLFENDELINAYDELKTIEPVPDNLLHTIQQSIFQNETLNKGALFSAENIRDGSIVINSCYSPSREVEVLYNYLVHLADKEQAQLSPRDIVVMVSDINLYASYIKAIFDNAPYKFRYTIADEAYAASDSISNALHAILSTTAENFSAEEVVRLLDSSLIRNRFGLTDTTLIRNTVNEANIRFGMEGSTADHSVYISWTYGLKRIMYGICMSGSQEFGEGPGSFYPLDKVEGNAAHELIRFVHFAKQLMVSLEERKNAKTIAGWVEYVDTVLHGFICKTEETTDEDYLQLVNQLEGYTAFQELFTEEVSYEVFMHRFLATLSGSTRKNSFASGGITFCSLIPMRSIPFKVVALLGLNFDKFPRKENSPGFNLMEKEKRKGDRNVKENDKHLFLETLLSAKDRLYISYIGQSIKDNSSIPPSTLVDELADFIATGAIEPKETRKQLITIQPLHSFSRQYLTRSPGLYSYLGATKPTVSNLLADKPAGPFNFEEIFLDGLVSFLKNPFKGYYNKVLGIYYNDDEISLRNTELFELDALQQWTLKNDLLPIDGEDERNQFKNRLIKTGALPLKNMAVVELEKVESTVMPIRELFRGIVKNLAEQFISVEIQLGEYNLKGSVKNIYDGNKLVVVSWSKRENKYLLDAYIRYLALRCAGIEVKPYFISFKKNSVFEAAEISKEEASGKLKDLLDLYALGHKSILAFDPDFTIEPGQVDVFDGNILQAAINAKFEVFGYPCTDTYMNNEYTNGFFETLNIVEDYRMVAEKLLVPLSQLFPGYYN
ncbi:MAG: exodeoxyribonuclease V subunit gamma [Ferruginibacter sp.]|nr:exodeoxyribonuclease V subunit gamma [Ferruginibacter sp.]